MELKPSEIIAKLLCHQQHQDVKEPMDKQKFGVPEEDCDDDDNSDYGNNDDDLPLLAGVEDVAKLGVRQH